MFVRKLRLCLPWTIATAALTYLAFTTDLSVVSATLAQLPVIPFLVTITVFVVLMYLVDVITYHLLFGRFFKKVSLRDLFSFKGASYVLQVFHYYLSGAVMAGLLHLRHRIPLAKCFSSLFWLALLDLVTISILLMIGYFLSSGIGDGSVVKYVVWCTALIVLGFAALSVLFRVLPDVMDRMKWGRIFYLFSRVRLSDFLVFICLRGVYLFLMILSNWFVLPFFGIQIPLHELMFFLPVLVLVGSIPLTSVAGLGTAQVVMRYLYADYAPNGVAQIDAFAITIVLVTVLLRLVIGIVWIPIVSTDLATIEKLTKVNIHEKI